MEDASDFLLRLYRAARTSDPAEFQNGVLKHLQTTVAFESAFWGEAHLALNASEVVPIALHLQNVDPQFLMEWTRAHHEDPTLPLLLRAEGTALRVHVPSFYAATADLAEIGRKHRIQSMTVILLRGLQPQQIQWLSLYQPRADALCSDTEKDWLEYVMPHLTEALSVNRALHLENSTNADAPGCQVAVAEASTGILLRADAGFIAMLAGWPGFDGRRLPAALLKGWQPRRSLVRFTRKARIDGRRFGELIYLSVREKTVVESLTPRQIDIADLYAQGLSHKEIAQRCGLAPATVRNHLALIYARPGEHGKMEMASRMEHLFQTADRSGQPAK